MTSFKYLLALIGFALPFNTAHAALNCSQAHSLKPETSLARLPEFSAEQLADWNHLLAEDTANAEDGLAVRGFLGSRVPSNAVTDGMALKHGLTWWRIRVYLLPTLDEAIAHRLKVRALHVERKTLQTDITTEPIYLIGTESELGVQFDGKNQVNVAAEKIVPLLDRPAYEINENGEAKLIATDRLKRRLNPDGFFLLKLGADSFGSNGLTQEGWVAPKAHGIHDYRTWKDSSTAKRLRKLIVKLAESGFTFRFNHDYEACMKMVLNQQRSLPGTAPASTSGATVEGDKKGPRVNLPITSSRYSNPKTRETMLNRLHAGRGYSIEIYNPEGRLVAGEFGGREGNHLAGDTIFYDTSYTRAKDGFDGVDLAKVAAEILFQYLDSKGQPFTDPGIVTPYTASMGADSIPFLDWKEKIKSGPRETIELPSTWTPFTESYWEQHFGDMVKKRNQGIGKSLVFTRMRRHDKDQIAIAASKNVFAGQQQFVVVKSLEEAQAHLVANFTSPVGLPLYVIGEPQGHNLAETLRKGEVIIFQHPRLVDKPAPLKAEKLIEQLQLNTLSENEVSQPAANVFEIATWNLAR